MYIYIYIYLDIGHIWSIMISHDYRILAIGNHYETQLQPILIINR